MHAARAAHDSARRSTAFVAADARTQPCVPHARCVFMLGRVGHMLQSALQSASARIRWLRVIGGFEPPEPNPNKQC